MLRPATYSQIYLFHVTPHIIFRLKYPTPRKTSAQYHVQHHHNAEIKREEQRTDIGMLSCGHFRNQLLNHHIYHGSCGKVQQIGQRRNHNAKIVSAAPNGSTIPENAPQTNARPFLIPVARSGMEMIAPSRKF